MTRDEACAEATHLCHVNDVDALTTDERRKAEDRIQYLFGYIDGLDAARRALVLIHHESTAVSP